MTNAKQLNDLVQQAAFRIVQVLNTFEDYPPHIRQQAEQFIMRRVQHMRSGVPQDINSVIEGDAFITVVEEPEDIPVPPAELPEVPPEEPTPPAP